MAFAAPSGQQQQQQQRQQEASEPGAGTTPPHPEASRESTVSPGDNSGSSSSATPTTSTTAGEGGAGSPSPYPFSLNPHLVDSRSNAPLTSTDFPSSVDDKFGVQKNWFTSLYKQLNYMAKTGAVPGLKGRQRAVFEQVEQEFETLYNRHIRGKGLDEVSHRALLMCCLSIATYRTLYDEVNDTRLVRDVIRTNLGSVMLSLLMPLHRFKLYLLSWLLREDMYKEATKMLPALVADMGGLCDVQVVHNGPGGAGAGAGAGGPAAPAGAAAANAPCGGAGGPLTSSPPGQGGVPPGPVSQQGQGQVEETLLKVHKCKYHEILTQEDTPFLLTEFCCHHSLIWLHEFRRHGVVVSMDQCKAWDDGCCQLRLARVGKDGPGGGGDGQA